MYSACLRVSVCWCPLKDLHDTKVLLLAEWAALLDHDKITESTFLRLIMSKVLLAFLNHLRCITHELDMNCITDELFNSDLFSKISAQFV